MWKFKTIFEDIGLLARLQHILGWTAGGVHKRIDENRELLELMRNEVPDFIARHPEVVGWLQAQDDFLCELASKGNIKEGRFFHLTNNAAHNFPRHWPGEDRDSMSRREAYSPRIN